MQKNVPNTVYITALGLFFCIRDTINFVTKTYRKIQEKLACFLSLGREISTKNTFFLHEMDKLTVVLMFIKWLNKIERPLAKGDVCDPHDFTVEKNINATSKTIWLLNFTTYLILFSKFSVDSVTIGPITPTYSAIILL